MFFSSRTIAQMDMLCDDLLLIICRNLILNSKFQLLMVNKHLRSLIQTQISRELETVTHILSQRLHNLCLRALTCLPVIQLQKCTQRNKIVTYTGETIRSNTRVVVAQWNYLDCQRFFLLSKKRVNSIMFKYHTRGATWDLNLKDPFRKPPDALLFIGSTPTTTTTTTSTITRGPSHLSHQT